MSEVERKEITKPNIEWFLLRSIDDIRRLYRDSVFSHEAIRALCYSVEFLRMSLPPEVKKQIPELNGDVGSSSSIEEEERKLVEARRKAIEITEKIIKLCWLHGLFTIPDRHPQGRQSPLFEGYEPVKPPGRKVKVKGGLNEESG